MSVVLVDVEHDGKRWSMTLEDYAAVPEDDAAPMRVTFVRCDGCGNRVELRDGEALVGAMRAAAR